MRHPTKWRGRLSRFSAKRPSTVLPAHGFILQFEISENCPKIALGRPVWVTLTDPAQGRRLAESLISWADAVAESPEES